MVIFKILDDIIKHKKGIIFENSEAEQEFSPYLTQRWLSMHSNDFAMIVNNSTNILWRGLDNNEIWYKLFMTVIPKTYNKQIKYLKKTAKKKKTEKEDDTKCIAENMELSQREVRAMTELKELIDESGRSNSTHNAGNVTS